MYDWISFINDRLDRLAVFPLAFVVVLSLFVVGTAVLEDSSAPQPARAAPDDLTTLAAAVP